MRIIHIGWIKREKRMNYFDTAISATLKYIRKSSLKGDVRDARRDGFMDGWLKGRRDTMKAIRAAKSRKTKGGKRGKA